MAADHLVRGSCVGVCIFVVMVVISVVIETMSIIIIRRNKKKYTPTAPMQVGWGGVSRSANSTRTVSASMPVFPQGCVDYKIELHA